MSFAFEKTPRMSLTCKLVPVQYREYEYGLLCIMVLNIVSPTILDAPYTWLTSLGVLGIWVLSGTFM